MGEGKGKEANQFTRRTEESQYGWIPKGKGTSNKGKYGNTNYDYNYCGCQRAGGIFQISDRTVGIQTQTSEKETITDIVENREIPGRKKDTGKSDKLKSLRRQHVTLWQEYKMIAD